MLVCLLGLSTSAFVPSCISYPSSFSLALRRGFYGPKGFEPVNLRSDMSYHGAVILDAYAAENFMEWHSFWHSTMCPIAICKII